MCILEQIQFPCPISRQAGVFDRARCFCLIAFVSMAQRPQTKENFANLKVANAERQKNSAPLANIDGAV